jgi:hypothetical protein
MITAICSALLVASSPVDAAVRPQPQAARPSSSLDAPVVGVARRISDGGRIPKVARHATSVIEIDRDAVGRIASAGGGTLHRFPLGPALDVDLELATVDPFDADATLVATGLDPKGAVVERPLAHAGVHLSGMVAGEADSHAFLSMTEAGTFGYVEMGSRMFIISSGPYGSRLGTASYELTALPEGVIETPAWVCGTADLPEPVAFGGEGGIAGTPPCRQVRVAWETDQEFLGKFGGNSDAATAYVGTLASALTSIYTRDVNVRLSVRYLRLWTTPDPWTAGDTGAQLEEFAGYWQANMSSLTRDLTHFLSGRGLGGGVAYLPGICSSGYGYGVSANLAGFFPTPLVDNNGQNWDIYVISHELGHNFGAPHTHNYTPVLDGCGSSPQDCTVANADEGTIMSYCHLCSGGVQNIKLRFHPGNIESIEARLAGIGCNYTGPATNPFGAPDRVSAISTIPLTIDVLANEVDFNCESVTIGTFLAETPDGATVTRSVGTGPNGRDQLVYLQSNPTVTGSDNFNYRVVDASGQETLVPVTVSVSSVRRPENPIGDIPGLEARYYALTSPTVLPNFATLTPYATTNVAQVNYASSNGNFATSGRSDNVGAVFSGWITVPAAGQWTFFTSSDDGSRLFIGAAPVVNNDGLHGMVEVSGSIALAAGTHAIRIEFFERTGGAGLIASWQGPGVAKAAIPALALTSGGTDPDSDLDNDGDIDAADLAAVLGTWGATGGPTDLNRDGDVGAADLAIILSDWTG